MVASHLSPARHAGCCESCLGLLVVSHLFSLMKILIALACPSWAEDSECKQMLFFVASGECLRCLKGATHLPPTCLPFCLPFVSTLDASGCFWVLSGTVITHLSPVCLRFVSPAFCLPGVSTLDACCLPLVLSPVCFPFVPHLSPSCFPVQSEQTLDDVTQIWESFSQPSPVCLDAGRRCLSWWGGFLVCLRLFLWMSRGAEQKVVSHVSTL